MPGFTPATRLKLPGYPFAELERRATEIRQSGRLVYNLSIGDPDLPPPQFVVDAVKRGLNDPLAHQYPFCRGDAGVRRVVANWFKLRFGVELDPDRQICILIGAKEGLANLARAVVNPGETVAVPDPGYPVYRRAGCRFVSAVMRPLPLNPTKGFLPDLNQVPGARLVYLNYPNNPTGAVAPDSFLLDLAELAETHRELTIAYDMAYGEVRFDHPSRSLLEFTRQAVEFHSLSKIANVTGYRVGFAVGDPDRITALVRVKEEVDSGTPLPFQYALAAVLEHYDGAQPPAEIKKSLEVYHYRKQRLTWALEHIGLEVFRSPATFYVWFRVGDNETEFVNKALEAGIMFTPGSAFGDNGTGWVRASVTVPDDIIDQVAQIISRGVL